MTTIRGLFLQHVADLSLKLAELYETLPVGLDVLVVAGICDRHHPPSLGVYAEADRKLRLLIDRAQIPMRNVFVVPGFYDIAPGPFSRNRERLVEALVSGIEFIEEVVEDRNDRVTLREPFTLLEHMTVLSPDDVIGRTERVNGVDFVAINSALAVQSRPLHEARRVVGHTSKLSYEPTVLLSYESVTAPRVCRSTAFTAWGRGGGDRIANLFAVEAYEPPSPFGPDPTPAPRFFTVTSEDRRVAIEFSSTFPS